MVIPNHIYDCKKMKMYGNSEADVTAAIIMPTLPRGRREQTTG